MLLCRSQFLPAHHLNRNIHLKPTFVRCRVFPLAPNPKDDIPDSWCGSPNTESLKDAQTRSWMFWRERVVPSIRDGKTVLICAHGNVIRAMLKRLDGIPNDPLKEVRSRDRCLYFFCGRCRVSIFSIFSVSLFLLSSLPTFFFMVDPVSVPVLILHELSGSSIHRSGHVSFLLRH